MLSTSIEIIFLLPAVLNPILALIILVVRLLIELGSCLDSLSSAILSTMSAIILIIVLAKLQQKYRGKNKTKYDARRLAEELKSKSSRAPAVSPDDLVEKITGFSSATSKKEESQFRTEIQKNIEKNIDEIAAFLKSDSGDNTLVIEGKWGSGKTTNILIAVNQLKAKKEYRYIYESAFKYTNGLNEYLTDLANTMFNIMDELGISEKKFVNDLIKNLHSNPEDTLISTLYSSAGNSLTSDIVFKINSDFRKKAKLHSYYIVIIMDDIDRLQGEDILKCLSVLSVLRRFDFVKIILPIDKDAVTHALDAVNLHDSDVFVRKYLPEQQTVYIESAYEIIKTTIIGKFGHSQETTNANFDGLWEAVLIKIWSVKLEELLLNIEKSGQSTSCAWPDISIYALNNLTWAKGRVYNFLRAPLALRNYNTAKIKSENEGKNSATWNYTWKRFAGHPRFEDILLRMEIVANQGKRKAVKDEFSEEHYNRIIHPWLQEYTSRHWENLNVNLRDIVDYIEAQDLGNRDWPTEQFEQFRVAFNALFSGELLKVVPDKDDEK